MTTNNATLRGTNSRGKVEIPETENDLIWQNRANDELVKLMDIVGDTEARNMTVAIEGTWKFIYDAIKELVARYSETQAVNLSFDKVLSVLKIAGLG